MHIRKPPRAHNEYLLSNLMAISDCIDVDVVGACSVRHQVDFREFCLKRKYNNHKNHCDRDQSHRAVNCHVRRVKQSNFTKWQV